MNQDSVLRLIVTRGLDGHSTGSLKAHLESVSGAAVKSVQSARKLCRGQNIASTANAASNNKLSDVVRFESGAVALTRRIGKSKSRVRVGHTLITCNDDENDWEFDEEAEPIFVRLPDVPLLTKAERARKFEVRIKCLGCPLEQVFASNSLTVNQKDAMDARDVHLFEHADIL